MNSGLYLDDLNIGDTFESDSYLISENEIISFALKYDPQLFHIDEIAANDSFFNGLAASGWNTASITMKLMVESFKLAEGLIGAGVQVEWPTITRPNDLLMTKSTIKDIKYSKTKPNQGIVYLESITTNQFGEIRAIINSKILCFKKHKRDHD